jgi:predicted transcriptional regulator
MTQPTIQLSPQLYNQYQQIAAIENKSLEDVVHQALEDEIDKRLWAIVDQRLSPADDARIHELMPRNNDGLLSPDEYQELVRLVKLVNEQMLQRSEALVLLKQRGHDIDTYLKSGAYDDE